MEATKSVKQEKKADKVRKGDKLGKRGKLKRQTYEEQLEELQGELVALQEWVKQQGLKICIVFEGRDGAGKGGAIKAIMERVEPPNLPRYCAASAKRPREIADVPSAVSAASPGRRRDRHL